MARRFSVVHYCADWKKTLCGQNYIKGCHASPLAWFVLTQENGCKTCCKYLRKRKAQSREDSKA
jgi:hypothetical protein